MTKWIPIGVLLVVMCSVAGGQEKPTPKQPKVSVILSSSVEAYDPSTPSKAVLKCVVRNSTAKAIQVPVRYDGNRIRLYSTSGLVLNQIKEDDLSRLERRITDLKRKIVAADDPEVIVSLAHDLAEAVKSRKEFESQRLVRMEPGQERLVFEFPLDDLLVRGQTQDGSLRWGWKRRPAPPKSPLYRRLGSREFVAEVTFTVRLKTGGQTVDSKPVRLKVKPSD